jgi:ketosteroid isomerase-like protein
MSRVFPLALGLMLLAGCSPQETGTSIEADRAAVEEASRAARSAIRGNDNDVILAALTADHLTMAPNQPIIPNGPDLRSWHETRIAAGEITQYEATTEDIVIAGDIAIERWSAELSATSSDGGPPITDRLKGIWMWQRQPDDTWKLYWSIWNSDNPVPTS